MRLLTVWATEVVEVTIYRSAITFAVWELDHRVKLLRGYLKLHAKQFIDSIISDLLNVVGGEGDETSDETSDDD